MQVYINTFEGAKIRIEKEEAPNIIIICNPNLSMKETNHFKQYFTRFHIAIS